MFSWCVDQYDCFRCCNCCSQRKRLFSFWCCPRIFPWTALPIVRSISGRRSTSLGISSHVFFIVLHVSLSDDSLRLCVVPSLSLSEREKFTVPLSTRLPSPLSNKACAFAKASSWGSCSIRCVTPVGVAALNCVVVVLSCTVPLFTIVNGGCELQAQALLIKSMFVCSNKLDKGCESRLSDKHFFVLLGLS